MSLKIYNTLTRTKEEFREREKGKVYMYVCGPTVHDLIHIGNARTFITFDVIRRYLRYRGYDVTYVQNITDIDDKIIKKSLEQQVPWNEIAQRYEAEYFEDIDSLNIQRPDISPRATDHVADMIGVIRGLISKGLAYVVDGSVYFDVLSYPAYGSLSARSLDELQAGARVEVDERKKNPADFALWKASKPSEPMWQSPWGMGRPGWHIECSAMSLKYLGGGFDIHGGASDLIFPHHENEKAQAEGYLGGVFVRYWVHGGMLNIESQEMHKSAGNFITVRDLMKQTNFNAVRLLMAQTHYRSSLDFSFRALEAAAESYRRLRDFYLRMLDLAGRRGDSGDRDMDVSHVLDLFEQLKSRFVEAMDDDFNAPKALGEIFEAVRAANSIFDSFGQSLNDWIRLAAVKAANVLVELCGVFGIELAEKKTRGDDLLVEKLLDVLIGLRSDARSRKDYGLADRIRDELRKVGIVLEDTSTGTRWKKFI